MKQTIKSLGSTLGYSKIKRQSASALPLNMCGWLEATDSASYAGSGQTVLNTVATPADGTTQAQGNATLGMSVAVISDDPTFTGSAGTGSAYFALDGGDHFKIANNAASVLANGHRTDTGTGWIAWAGTVAAGDGAIHALYGNASGGTNHGLSAAIDASGVFALTQRNGTQSTTVTLGGVPRGVPVAIIVTWDGTKTTNNVRVWINCRRKMQTNATFKTDTAASTTDFYICSSNNTNKLGAGSRFKSFLWGNLFIDDAQAAQIFAKLKTKHGYGYSDGWVRGPGSQPQALILGDSITYYNQYPKLGGTDNVEANAEGWFTCYNALSNHVMDLPQINNMGVVGDTTSQILGRVVGLMSGTRAADVVFVLGGTNDIAGNASPGTSVYTPVTGNLAAMLDAICLQYGKPAIIQTILPRTMWGSFTAPQIAVAKQDITDINTWIMTQNGTRGGLVKSVNTFPAINDGTGAPVANATADNLHLAPYGGMLVGQYLYTALNPVYGNGPAPNWASNNLLANGTLSGTGGTVTGAGVSGSAADNFILTYTGGTGGSGTLAGSKPSSSVQQIALNWGAGSSDNIAVKFTQTVSSGFAVGDTVYGMALIEVTGATPVKILENALGVYLTGTGTSGVVTVGGMNQHGTAGKYVAETYITPGQYMVQTADLYISAGTGLSLEWRFRITGDTAAGAAASGTVQVKGAGLFRR